MSSQPKCPFCERPITIWAVLKAPMPWAIRCPHCREKITVRDVRVYLTAYILIVVALAAGLIIARRRALISSEAVVGIAVVFLVMLELATSFVVLRRATFVKPGL